jgi:hypothetical protein
MHMVRSPEGLIPSLTLDDHGLSINLIKDWRKCEFDAGRPSSLRDCYDAHGICSDCGGYGAQMIGWSLPTPEEVRLGREPDDDFPVYSVCPSCKGTGKV